MRAAGAARELERIGSDAAAERTRRASRIFEPARRDGLPVDRPWLELERATAWLWRRATGAGELVTRSYVAGDESRPYGSCVCAPVNVVDSLVVEEPRR